MVSAITVDHVSKRYSIGQLQRETMIREVLVNLVKAPFQRRRKAGEVIWALKDVSFAVSKGEVVGVMGRNGAGKSTLLKILSKITYPTAGSIDVQGRVTSLLEVGTGFHEELTGRENVYLNGSILGMKKREIDAKMDTIVDFAGVEKFMDTPIKFYSSGMRLRLGFAVAAHLDTEVLLVDEVLAVGDVDFQKKCLRKMDKLQSAGRTVLFVSHNLAAIENLCPRAIWIDSGQVRRDGEARAVIKDYMASYSPAERVGPGLLHIEQRKGTGEVQFTGMEFLDAEGQPQPVTRTGDRLTLRLHYRAQQPVKETDFGISLWTDLGTMITMLSTSRTGVEIPSLPAGQGAIEVTLDSLNLAPGRYLVSIWATGPNHYGSVDHCYDVLDHCAELNIEPSDFYKSGRGVQRRFGLVFFPCSWQLKKNEEIEPTEACTRE
jgi:lipopolysaccharide transport system ATP-binding protein